MVFRASNKGITEVWRRCDNPPHRERQGDAVPFACGTPRLTGQGWKSKRFGKRKRASIVASAMRLYAAKQEGKDCVRHQHLNRSGTSDMEATPMPEMANHRPFMLSPSPSVSHVRGR